MDRGAAVVPGEGWSAIVVGAELAGLESSVGAATVGDGNATWVELGVFVGCKGGRITSVSGCFTDPHNWLFDGKLIPFAGDLGGVKAESSATDIEGIYGPPRKVEDSKPWCVLYYEGIYFTFFEGALTSFTIGEEEDEEDDDEDEGLY